MSDDSAQQRAAMLLRAGQLIGLPTETVYGLAADASIESAVAEIYRVKGRPADHPLIVHVAGLIQAQYWADFAEDVHPFAKQLSDAFWPGPMTLIMNRKPQAPAYACADQATIGLRVPSHPVAQGVMKHFHGLGGKGIAAPSANRFGRISPTRAEHVRADLGEDIAWVLEGGDADIGIESTIIDLSRQTPVILRPGHISSEAISAVLGRKVHVRSKDGPQVSGTLEAHYAPVTPMMIFEDEALPMRAAEFLNLGEKIAVWVSADLAIFLERVFGHQVPVEYLHFEVAAAEPEVFAQEMYAKMREMDSLGVQRILVEALPNEPEWLAVKDRLYRAQKGSNTDQDSGEGLS
jgi:L-threonylcarbamoyladenylate synthase